jgi:hypothetical protein
MAAAKKSDDPVYGTVAEAPGATVPVGERATAVNLTGDGPVDPSDKPVTMQNPLGDAKITVSSEVVKFFEDAGYKRAK